MFEWYKGYIIQSDPIPLESGMWLTKAIIRDQSFVIVKVFIANKDVTEKYVNR